MLGSFVHFGIAAALAAAGGVAGAQSAAQQTAGRAAAHEVLGYDVGAESCSTALPKGGSFGVIAATAGKPFHPSHCLRAEYTWAQGHVDAPQYYVNLADPGHKSAHWGAGGPKTCHKAKKYDVGCAYDYGLRTAEAALHDVKTIGSTGHGRWWVDVEQDNSWGTSRAGIAANIADIEGALHYLRTRPGLSAGVYTETAWWDEITDGVRMSHTFVWGGGADTKHNAKANCRKHSITGGPAKMAQWFTVGGPDHDIAC